VRWTDAPSEDALDRRAGELLKLPPPAPLGAVRRARIELRLAARPGPSPGIRLRYVLPGVAVALVVAGSVVAAVGARRHRSGDGDGAVPGDVVRSRPHVHAARDPVAPVVTPVPPEASAAAPAPASVAEPLLAPAPPAETAPRVRHVKANVGGAAARRDREAPPPPALVAPPGPLSEPRLLAEARARLQVGHDARGALALVAEHQRRFPRGALALEARITEVESLVVLGRRSEALTVLELLSLDGLPRSAELGVLRGELRAEAGRHRDAIADFTPCADVATCRPETAERALYGRASCRERVGARAAARADLERYLARFPQGRFARAVRAALDAP
jgi:hypothetical protein